MRVTIDSRILDELYEETVKRDPVPSGLIDAINTLSDISSDIDDEAIKQRVKDVNMRLIDLWSKSFDTSMSLYVEKSHNKFLKKELEIRKAHPIKNWFNPI